MAGKATTLAIKITSDNQTKSGFAEAGRDVDGFASKMDKASLVAGGALATIGALGKGAVDAASDFQQSSGAVESIFGKYSSTIENTAQHAATLLGLSANQYQESAAVLGAQLKNMGFSAEDTAGRTDQLINMGADLAATFGGSTKDAVEALSSAFKGETDPIERYGISIKQADINTLLASRNQDKLTGTAAKQAQAMAVLDLVSQQSSSSVGQFAAQTNTAAEQSQIAQAKFDDAKTKLGTGLLPVMTKLYGIAAKVGNWFGEHTGVVQVMAGVIAGLALAVLAVNGAMTAWSTLTKIATALQWLWDAALDANPIGILVVVIAAVIAAVVLMYQKFGWFRDFIKGVGAFFGTVFDGLKGAIGWVVDKIKWLIDKGGAVVGWVKNVFSAPAAGPGGGQPAGLYGAAPGGFAVRTAGRTAAGAGAALAGAGGSAGGGTVVELNVTFTGVVGDPVAVGAQIDRVVRDWSRATGRQLTATMSR